MTTKCSNEIKIPIGQRIRIGRDKAGVSQARLGALLYPPKSGGSIADIEAGRSSPSWETVVQIAEQLELPLDFFRDDACPTCGRDFSE